MKKKNKFTTNKIREIYSRKHVPLLLEIFHESDRKLRWNHIQDEILNKGMEIHDKVLKEHLDFLILHKAIIKGDRVYYLNPRLKSKLHIRFKKHSEIYHDIAFLNAVVSGHYIAIPKDHTTVSTHPSIKCSFDSASINKIVKQVEESLKEKGYARDTYVVIRVPAKH